MQLIKQLMNWSIHGYYKLVPICQRLKEFSHMTVILGNHIHLKLYTRTQAGKLYMLMLHHPHIYLKLFNHNINYL
jgi:hypothetical protein